MPTRNIENMDQQAAPSQAETWQKLSYAQRFAWLQQAKIFAARALQAAKQRDREAKQPQKQ